jgi:hypothetical protein
MCLGKVHGNSCRGVQVWVSWVGRRHNAIIYFGSASRWSRNPNISLILLVHLERHSLNAMPHGLEICDNYLEQANATDSSFTPTKMSALFPNTKRKYPLGSSPERGQGMMEANDPLPCINRVEGGTNLHVIIYYSLRSLVYSSCCGRPKHS